MDPKTALREILGATNELYAAVSFGCGQSPDPRRLQNLFLPEAVLVNNTTDPPDAVGIDEFTARLADAVRDGHLKSFVEREVSGETHIFGTVAHRSSTYEAFIDGGIIPVRGMNSIQFVRTGGRWLVSAIAWSDPGDAETVPGS